VKRHFDKGYRVGKISNKIMVIQKYHYKSKKLWAILSFRELNLVPPQQ
jgi:hypothetical protein